VACRQKRGHAEFSFYGFERSYERCKPLTTANSSPAPCQLTSLCQAEPATTERSQVTPEKPLRLFRQNNNKVAGPLLLLCTHEYVYITELNFLASTIINPARKVSGTA